jgi:hypothetical protein
VRKVPAHDVATPGTSFDKKAAAKKTKEVDMSVPCRKSKRVAERLALEASIETDADTDTEPQETQRTEENEDRREDVTYGYETDETESGESSSGIPKRRKRTRSTCKRDDRLKELTRQLEESSGDSGLLNEALELHMAKQKAAIAEAKREINATVNKRMDELTMLVRQLKGKVEEGADFAKEAACKQSAGERKATWKEELRLPFRTLDDVTRVTDSAVMTGMLDRYVRDFVPKVPEFDKSFMEALFEPKLAQRLFIREHE